MIHRGRKRQVKWIILEGKVYSMKDPVYQEGETGCRDVMEVMVYSRNDPKGLREGSGSSVC